MRKRNGFTVLALAALVAAPALAEHGHKGPAAHAYFHNNAGEAVGEAHIDQGPHGILVTLTIDGLEPGKKAIHIHSKGTCDDHEEGFQDSGGHLNPDDRKHGLMNPDGPDAGDFTNFYVHDNGYAWAELFNKRASLDGSYGAKILDEDGAALVIHENPDDHVSQPIGGAGARVACAVIEPHH
ncbi:MAG: superoxide dismutase family protein [Halomonadaceae bacterium]|nr:MAG: superoxide dismutase family protein [Halomonadaceae bacterium]